MSELIEGFEAVSIHVRDIEKAKRFYSEVLGLKLVQFDEKISRAAFALPGGPTLLTMHIMAPGEGGRDAGTVSGVVFSHHDPPSACEEIRRRGGTITEEAKPVQMGPRKFVRAVFADPDGNEFILRSSPTLG